jgi:NOL1/NOP2/fmu family ribosome biogenesis protein
MVPAEINDFQFIHKHLKIISAGTKLYTLKNRDYIPSHELALSNEIKKEVFPAIELEYSQAIDFLQRGNIKIRPEEEGWFILSYNGVNLGFAKNIGSRVNNYYPVNWRIRMRSSGNDMERLILWH